MTVITYRQALHDTLRDELLRDERTSDGRGDRRLRGLLQDHRRPAGGIRAQPGRRHADLRRGIRRRRDGAAMLGLRPIVEIMTINFILLALDQIVNHAAKIHSMFGGQVSVPLVIRTPGGGGQQLAATHSQNLEVWFAHVPGMKVLTPATPADAKGLLTAAIRDDDPVLFFENLALYDTKGDVPDGEQIGRIGTAPIAKPGTDITVVAYSRSTVIAMDVARQFEANGVCIEVVDLRSLRPLDRETIFTSIRRRTGPSSSKTTGSLWRWRRDRGNDRRRCVRLSRCPDPPGRCRRSAPALCEAARAGGLARRRRPGQGHR